MIRTVITPQNDKISIELPQNYVGKKVEVIAFTLEETTDSDVTVTHFASQASLAQDWLTKEEDKAWQDL